LQSGLILCGRQDSQHMLRLYEAGKEALCINLASGVLWSYLDDAELVDAAEFDEFLRRGDTAGLLPCDAETVSPRPAPLATMLTTIDWLTVQSVVLGRLKEALGLEAEPERVARAGSEPTTPSVGAAQRVSCADLTKHHEMFGLPDEGGMCGLVNLGNTCFLNAGLQALMCIPPLRKQFTRLFMSSPDAGTVHDPTLAAAFQDLALEMFGGSASVASPRLVLRALRKVNRMFAGFEQHDAHEALRFILNDIHEGMSYSDPNWVAASPPPTAPPAELFSPIAVDDSRAPSALSSPVAADASATKTLLFAGSSDESDDAKVLDPDASFHHANTSNTRGDPPVWAKGGPYVPEPSARRSPVSDTFQGTLCSRVRCRECRHESITFDTFMDLSLQIPDGPYSPSVTEAGMLADGALPAEAVAKHGFRSRGSGRGGWCSNWFSARSISIADCLHSFCDADPLTGDEKYYCERCGGLRSADKAFGIVQLPEVLCFHLKRFSHSGMWGKVSTFVDYPLTSLDMQPFVWSEGVSAAETIVRVKEGREARARAAAERHWREGGEGSERPPLPPPVISDTPFSDEIAKRIVSDHAQSVALKRRGVDASGGPCDGPFVYDLVSIVQHLGVMGGGHYVAYGRREGSGKWLNFDDESVSEVSTVAGHEAYILFYQRRRVAPAAPLPRPVPAAGTFDVPVFCWVSSRWWLQAQTMSAVGPVCSSDIMCPHGRLRHNLLSPPKDLATAKWNPLQFCVALTREQWCWAVSRFGRKGPALFQASACPACKVEAHALRKRRERENAEISRVDVPASSRRLTDPSAHWHLISTAWLTQWHAFKNDCKCPVVASCGVSIHWLVSRCVPCSCKG
jgi:ubiquitin C-terminal hydrolase